MAFRITSNPWLIGSVFVVGLVSGAQGQVELHRLEPELDGGSHSYGAHVAVDGNLVIVGDPFDDDEGNNSGSVSVYDASSRHRLYEIYPADGGIADTLFGSHVDARNGILVIGRETENVVGSYSGSVYLYDLLNKTELFKITPSNGASMDRFGFRVATDGSKAVIGAQGQKAYIFDVATGTEDFVLVPSVSGGQFGWSVGIDGNLAIVGARTQPALLQGVAYLFDVSTGLELFQLVSDDIAIGDVFGTAVAVGGGRAYVGAPNEDEGGNDSGAVYVFDTTTGEQLDKLIASDAAGGEGFGSSLCLDGNRLYVGAPSDVGPNGQTGSVYLFNVTTREEVLKFFAADGLSGDLFGSAIAADGDIAAIGAEAADPPGGANQGVTYVYDVALPLSITAQPVSALIDTGDPAQAISVTVDSAVSPVSYQWRRDGAPILPGPEASGETTDTLTLSSVLMNRATYDVVVTNALNSVVSSAAVLGVRNAFPADLNGDGIVDTADLGILLGVFGATGP